MTNSSCVARTPSRVGSAKSRLLVLAAALGSVAVTVGALAQTAAVAGWHHGGHLGAHLASASPADVADHVDAILQHVYAETAATPEQQARIAPLVQASATDLAQFHTQFHAQHTQMLTLLMADPIDRVALENARVAQVNLLDQASREIVQLLADTAGVLTPDQRKAVAEKVAAHLAPTQD